jgi:hypothetical protein
MISYAWAEVVKSDFALPAGEWAAVRMSIGAERKIVEASHKHVCSTFLFRSCGGQVLRLIVAQDQPKPSLFRRLTMAQQIKSVVARHRPDVETPLSAVTFAMAVALVPDALPDLREVAAGRRCEGCTCILRQDGPTAPESPVGRFTAAQIAASPNLSKYAERVGAPAW